MERIFEFVTGIAGSGPTVFNPGEASAVDRGGAPGRVHGAHHATVDHNQRNKDDDGRDQQVEPNQTAARCPAKGEDGQKYRDTHVPKPKMPALELAGRGFTLLEPKVIFKLWGRGSESRGAGLGRRKVGLCRFLTHWFDPISFWLLLRANAKKARARALFGLWPMAFSGIEGCTADKRPAFDGTPVAGLPVSIFGFQGEAGIDDEVHGGLVFKADVNGVVFTGGEYLGVGHRVALYLFKEIEAAGVLAAGGGCFGRGG